MSTRKISQLPAATGIDGADLVPIVQGGTTKRVAVSVLAVAGPTGPAGPEGAGEAFQGPTAPAEASPGATWFNSTDGRYFVRYEDVWVEVGNIQELEISGFSAIAVVTQTQYGDLAPPDPNTLYIVTS
jgi:hypothetical protein